MLSFWTLTVQKIKTYYSLKQIPSIQNQNRVADIGSRKSYPKMTDLRTYFVVDKSYKKNFYLQNSRRNRLFATKNDSILKLFPDWSSNQWSVIIILDVRFSFKYYIVFNYWVPQCVVLKKPLNKKKLRKLLTNNNFRQVKSKF